MPHWYDVTAWNERFGNDSQTVHSLRKFRTRWLKQGWSFADALSEVAPSVAAVLQSEIEPHPLALAERLDSQLDGATKLLFRTDQGLMIESVILRAGTGRTSLCISSQIGCAAACRFCATGQMGIARNLSAAQILDQVVQANQLLREEDRRVRNIVFMGMGEPLHNPANLHEVITALTSPLLFDYSQQRLLVSTVGIPDEMLRLDERFPSVNLALSLHSANDLVRQDLIPLAKSVSLSRLKETLLQLQLSDRRQVMIEYLMLEDRTDRVEDAEKLIGFLKNIHAHVNLIPYNSIDGADHLRGSTQAARDRFAELLKQAGFPVTIRYSLGADIAAACGQLIQRENREIAKQLRANPAAT
ncbi:putative dual-specificity RNA methyltransferase RlmN [Bremerella volcania]|uniref:Putative dual-specificity RNA methyltransferase RlmN n=1 Tax=Bremerella volcania TaxID=2527984 RepID=A0A518CFB1_9BACT|nr:23S rRNA (adenine(2503)-C(2))-methyltransferase RlmN [Bremerella volcania]QDU77920.1 putative dual-specificity RNA methyltransferase RlmN [Bremerella volcania]